MSKQEIISKYNIKNYKPEWWIKRFKLAEDGSNPRCRLCGSTQFVTTVGHWKSHSLWQRILFLILGK